MADCEPLTRKVIGFCDPDWDEACLRSSRNWREVRQRLAGAAAVLPASVGASASLRALAGGAAELLAAG